MFSTNNNNISMINSARDNNSHLNINWLQNTDVNDDLELFDQYANICQQHKQEKKWVLFINPEESSIEQLAKTHGIDVSKILMVNYKSALKSNAKIDLEQVKSVLSKGNCSAVILSNTSFKNEEITQLENSACEGKTQCVLLKKRVLH
jgi:cell division inhibitor SulA